MVNPLLIPKSKQIPMSSPERQSPGILDDFAVRKSIATQEIQATKSNSTTMITNLNADLLDGSHAAAFEPAQTKGDLTATSPIALSATRQVIGGAAVVSIANAAADGATKGAAAFNSTNFSASTGVVNTIQDIASTASPQFANLVITAGGDIRPSANATNAINIAQADGTDFVSFDTTNKRIGINTTAPLTALEAVGADGISAVRYGGNSAFQFIRGNGTQASPSAVLSGELMGQFASLGYYDGASKSTGSDFLFYASANWTSSSAHPSHIVIRTSPTSGGIAERMRIDKDGMTGIGATAPDARLEVETTATEAVQALTLDQNDADIAFVDYQGTSAANAANNISTWTNATVAGYVKVEINGAAYWMPYYNAPTS